LRGIEQTQDEEARSSCVDSSFSLQIPGRRFLFLRFNPREKVLLFGVELASMISALDDDTVVVGEAFQIKSPGEAF
jgi:hypothetical protein